MKYKWISLIIAAICLLVCILFPNLSPKTAKVENAFLFDTYCSITAGGKKADKAVSSAIDRLTEIHNLCDYYSKSSEVYKINNARANKKIKISREMFDILSLAQEIYQKSNGRFEITCAPVSMLWKRAGDMENPRPPTQDEIQLAMLRICCANLVLDETDLTVTKRVDHLEIDLGGIAKGYAQDKAVEILKNHKLDYALVDLGGSISCFGENPYSENSKWRIGLQTPFEPTGSYYKTVELTCGALVTCGTYQRYFEYDGKIYHHIIDPFTGYPAEQSFSSVTVQAESAAVSDALATAVFVIGKEKGEVLAKEYNAQLYFK